MFKKGDFILATKLNIGTVPFLVGQVGKILEIAHSRDEYPYKIQFPDGHLIWGNGVAPSPLLKALL